MSFGIFDLTESVEHLIFEKISNYDKLERLGELLGEHALPRYLRRYIERTSSGRPGSLFLHAPLDISGYADADMGSITRTGGFIGKSQMVKAPSSTTHHIFICHNNAGKARVV